MWLRGQSTSETSVRRSIPIIEEVPAPGLPFYSLQVLAKLAGKPAETLDEAITAMASGATIEAVDGDSVTVAGDGSSVYDLDTGILRSVVETENGKVVRTVELIDYRLK